MKFIVEALKIINGTHPSINTSDEKLQGRTIDTVKAYQEVQSCILDMRVVRDKIGEEFLFIYRQAERITTSLDVSSSVPRTVSSQMHRSNIPANTPEEYYRRVLVIPVLETFIAEMEFRFNEFNQRVSTLLTLIPSIITKPDYHGEPMAYLIGLYRNYPPNPDMVDQELLLWKDKWSSTSAESRPSTFAEFVKKSEEKIPKCVCALEDRVNIASN